MIRQTPATLARQKKGWTLKQAAKKVGKAPRTLRHIELHGTDNYFLARAIASHYGCSITCFM